MNKKDEEPIQIYLVTVSLTDKLLRVNKDEFAAKFTGNSYIIKQQQNTALIRDRRISVDRLMKVETKFIEKPGIYFYSVYCLSEGVENAKKMAINKIRSRIGQELALVSKMFEVFNASPMISEIGAEEKI
jgi:hypothetical protein